MKKAKVVTEDKPKERPTLAPDAVRGQELLAFNDLKFFGIGYSRVHLQRLIKAGAFPQPVRLGGNRVAFVRENIMAWIKSRQPVQRNAA